MGKKQRNAIRNGKPLKGIKNAAFTKDYSLNEFKTVSRRIGVTINDVLMTVTS